jgi:FkbM family methyltransferase
MVTRAQIEAARARFQLAEGTEELRLGPSRFGRAGLIARNAVLRVTRPLAVREALLDERLLIGLEALAMDTAVSNRAASSFPERLSQESVTDVTTRIGNLYMHADDRVMTPFMRQHHVWEEGETAFLEAAVRPGATFVDVGANIGYFSVLGARLVGSEGRVIAIEPERRNISLLKANLWRHGCDNSVILPIAAYRERGFVPLRLNEENRGDHQVGWDAGASALVPCARLDELLGGVAVDVVKVDTQGVDHDVIAGLSGLIRRGRAPTIMCEFWLEGMAARRIHPQGVAEGYERLGFELSLLDEDGSLRAASPLDVVAAAEAATTGFVNVVLRAAQHDGEM